MEVEVLKSFFARLVTATSDCILSIADRSWSQGLIPRSVYNRILHGTGIISEEDKARILLQTIMTTTEEDGKCFAILLKILEETLPSVSGLNIVLDMSRELDSLSGKAVIPMGKALPFEGTMELSMTVSQQDLPFKRYEEVVRKEERAIAEKNRLEDCLRMKALEFEALKNAIEHETSQTKTRLSTSEAEIEKLKQRLAEVESYIEEYGMKLRRGRTKVCMDINDLICELNDTKKKLSMANKREEELLEEIDDVERTNAEELQKSEEQHKALLTDKENMFQVKKAKYKAALKEQEEKYIKMLESKEAEIEKRVEEKVKIRELQQENLDLKLKESKAAAAENQSPPTTVSKKKSDQKGSTSKLRKWLGRKRKSKDANNESPYGLLPWQDKHMHVHFETGPPPTKQNDEKSSYDVHSLHSLALYDERPKSVRRWVDASETRSMNGDVCQKTRKHEPSYVNIHNLTSPELSEKPKRTLFSLFQSKKQVESESTSVSSIEEENYFSEPEDFDLPDNSFNSSSYLV